MNHSPAGRYPRTGKRSPAVADLDGDLRRLVAEGRASGKPVDGETALTRLRAKYAAMTVS